MASIIPEQILKAIESRLVVSTVLTVIIVILSMTSVFVNTPVIPADMLYPILFFLTLPLFFWTGKSIYTTAFKQLTSGTAGIYTLAALGSGAALLYSSAVAWFPGWRSLPAGSVYPYFDSAAIIITLMVLGRYMEEKTRIHIFGIENKLKSGKSAAGQKLSQPEHEPRNTGASITHPADNIASKIIWAVFMIALISLLITLFQASQPGLNITAFRILAILIMACPWTLGLAVPAAATAGIEIAAEYGILIKSSGRLETVKTIDTIVFDKTGILTLGELLVARTAHGPDISENHLLILAASAVQYSDHPLAKAITREARIRSLLLEPVNQFNVHPGFGVSTRWKSHLLSVGDISFMDTWDISVNHFSETISHWQKLEYRIVMVVLASTVQGLIAIQDPIRSGAFQIIQNFRKKGVSTVLLSGDTTPVTQQVGRQIGIDRIYGNVLPDQKYQIIRELQMEGQKVAMVSDGFNDAPALAAADFSIVMAGDNGCPTERADIVIVQKNLWRIPESLEFTVKVISAIKQNLFWVLFFNIIGIAAAAGVLYPVLDMPIQPVYTAVVMTLGAVSMIINQFHFQRTSSFIFDKRNTH